MESSITVHNNGGVSVSGPDAVNLFRAITLKHSLSLWSKTGIVPTRGVTITVMLKIAKEYTGKTYKRTQASDAIADLQIWIDTMKAAMPYERD